MTRIRLFLLAAMLALTSALAVPSVVHAQDGAPITIEDAGSEFVISPLWWTFLAGVAIPFILEFLQKANLAPFWKQILAVIASAISTLIIRATKTDGTGVIDQSMLLDFLVTFMTAFLTHRHLIRNTKLNGGLAPGFGIGPSSG